eukprot:c13315_g1_i1.p1 GENE.c13315_g1_i1~~c13315_g1_i1.p1  ORF type:complete len:398 (-),score=121.63 c13315_g1_i1:44-1237(-)
MSAVELRTSLVLSNNKHNQNNSGWFSTSTNSWVVWARMKMYVVISRYRPFETDGVFHVSELPPEEQNNAAISLIGLLHTKNPNVFILGEMYNLHSQGVQLLSRITSLCRMTYRTGFELVEGYNTDMGWGCMMRTGQMVLANSLIRLFFQKDWRVTSCSQYESQRYKEFLSLFSDTMRAPISIQRIALMGEQLDIKVGQWFGPTTICHVLKRLVMANISSLVRVYVSQDAVIYEDEIIECSKNWTKPVLLLIPLRLGLQFIEPSLAQMAAETLTLPQSLGIIGGKKSTSFYFVGKQENNLLFIDPHYPQSTVPMDNFSFESFHSSQLAQIKLTEMDPSLAIAFLCRSQQDLDEIRAYTEYDGRSIFALSSMDQLECLSDSVMSEGEAEAEGDSDWEIV